MREVADAGMVSRIEAVGTAFLEHIAQQQSNDKPRYFRGALIKPKTETKTNGK